MKESEKRKRRVLTTGECCDPVSKMSHHMKKGDEWGTIWHERFENSGSVDCRGFPFKLNGI